MVISAPMRAPDGSRTRFRSHGAGLLDAERDNDTGVGNFGHLGQLADTAMVTGSTVIGSLPLVATFPDQPSPYAPASRRAWNELFVDLAAAPGWETDLPVYAATRSGWTTTLLHRRSAMRSLAMPAMAITQTPAALSDR